MHNPPETVCAFVGKAVLATQQLEHWIVVAYYSVRIASEPTYRLSEAQLSDIRLFKEPTKNILKRLDAASQGQSSSDLCARVTTLLEQRHELTHRWFLRNGLPSTLSSEQWESLGTLADHVAAESNELSYLLLSRLLSLSGHVVAGRSPDELAAAAQAVFGQPPGACA